MIKIILGRFSISAKAPDPDERLHEERDKKTPTNIHIYTLRIIAFHIDGKYPEIPEKGNYIKFLFPAPPFRLNFTKRLDSDNRKPNLLNIIFIISAPPNPSEKHSGGIN